jgi:ParB/RepB/Spo0J family partition protein
VGFERILVPLALIQPNPYQPRQSEDPAAVAEFAADIYRRGLQEIPSARAVNGHYELAFGHTRRAAFQLLAEVGVPDAGILADEQFAEMPLEIRELTNREMFEWALGENLKRRQLNAIEQAASMKLYMAEFQASSRDAAELFGCSDATVRGTVRLLNLPAAVQTKIASGEITQGVARKLLTVGRIIQADAMGMIVKRIVAGDDPDGVIEVHTKNSRNVVVMSEKYSGSKDRAGQGLWLLDDTFADTGLAELTAKHAAQFCAHLVFSDPTQATAEEASAYHKKVSQYLKVLASREEPGLAGLVERHPDDADLIEQIAHLLWPPACSACPYHVQAGGCHLCGLKGCHARKSAAWAGAELQILCREMSIPVYAPDVDGKAVVRLPDNAWGEDMDRWNKLVDQKDPSVRLFAHHGNYAHRWTKSNNVCVIVVGEMAQAIIDEQKSKSNGYKDEQEKQREEMRLRSARRGGSEKFFNHCIPALFAPAFKGLDHVAALCALTGKNMPKGDEKRAEMISGLHMALAQQVFRDVLWMNEAYKGPVALAKYFKKVAVTWGVELPADFLEIAKQYEPVSTETPKGKSQ